MTRLLESSDVLFGIISVVDLFVELVISAALEGEVAHKHDEGHHTQSPNISCLSTILSLLDNLRSHITWSSTKYFHLNKPIFTLV
jgi:hypothetical protein